MKSKKLISLLCAAAMTTSAFAGLVTTASAATENDILWSDTFNNAATGVFLDGTAGLNGNKNAIENSTAVNGLKFVTTNRSNGDAAGYTDSNGEYVYNGSYYAINEKADATDKYVRMGFPVFGDFAKNGRWAYVDLGEAGYTATAEKDVIMDFDLKLTSGLDKGEIDATEGLKPVLRVGSFDATAKTANAVEIKGEVTGDDWVDARIIVSDSTGAKLYINGEEVTDAANTSVKTLETIGLYSADGQTCGKAMADLVGNSSYDEDGTLNDATKKTLTPTADIDNVIIYNETAGVADGTSQAPGAQDQEGGTTPPPAPTEKVIPAVDMTLQAPENATNVQSYTFDDKAIKKWSLGTADTDDSTTIPGLNIHVGARDKGGTVATYAAVVGLSQGNALQLVADQYSTAGRTPRINFTTGLPIDAATNLSTALTFNVYLSAVEGKEDIAKPRLYFLKDTAQTGDDGAGGFRNVAAVLTASEGDVLYRGDDAASDVISAYIAPNEWHKVTMVITPSSTGSTYRVYIDDDYDNATLSLQYIATGDNATSMSDLPYIAVEGQAAKVGGVDTTPTYGVATIDNIVAYQGVVENPKQMLPVVAEAPTPAPPTATPQPKHNVTVTYDGKDKATVSTTETEAFDAVMAIAKYSNEGVLLSVDTKDVKGISSAKGVEVQVGAMNNGDQLMVWNSLEDMIPYGSLVITNGGTQPVAITGTVKVEGTAKVGETLTAAVEGLNEGATAKYEWQANTGADGAYEKITGATAATFVVTEDLVGKTIKVVVTAIGYTGSIESAPTAAVEAADEEPVAVPTVETATLHDTSEAVQDEDLYAEGSYKVTTTDETGYTKVAIAIEDLKEHRNADTPESFGYWVGAKVTAPEGKTIKGYYFSKDKYVAGTSDFTECDENEISFYTNVGAKDQKIWAAVELSDESIYVYKLDTTGVKKYSIYTFDDAGLTSGQISYSLTASDVTQTNVTDDEEAKASVADFGAGTEKVEAIPALDGWGYKHFAYSSMYKDDVFQAGRQSTASVDVEANAIFANGVGNKGCDGAVSFIPANNANATAKLDGMDKLIYTFDAIVTTTGGNQQGSPIIGITSATDGSTVVSEASTTIAASGVNDQAVTKKVVIEYGLTNKAYMIYVDGTVVASGVAANVPTGIYAQSIDKYIKVGIANLVVTGEETTDINGVTVTTPSESDGTLIVDKAAVKAGDTITITATPAAGKKVTAVKVNGEAVKYSDGYKYTVTGEEEAIVIIAEFARADATAVTVTGADSVTKGEKATYTAKVMSENLEIAGDITWSVAAAGGEKSADTTISDTGELTVAEDETAASLIVTASTKKDVANADDDTVVTGTKTVTVSSVAVYDVTKGETVNGTFTITPDSAQVAAGTEMTVVPSQEEGYQVKEVSYVETDDAEATAVKVENSNGYTFYAPAYNFTVNVEFEAIEYNITNNNSSADEHGNSVAIKVNGEDATTATIGQTVTIKPTVAQGYKVDTVKVMNGELPVEVSNNTFTMPAADVTVTVTFAKWDGIYYSEDFSAYNAGDAVAPWNNANGTYRNAAFAAEDDNVYLHGSCSGKQVGHVIHTLENPVSLQDQKVVVEYDFRVPSHDVSVISGVVTLGDSSDNVVLAVGQSTLESYDMVYYTGGAFDTVVNNGRWGVDENAESATAIQTGAANTTNWYHVKIVFDNGTADLTVTEKGNESNTYTASDIAVSSTDIENIKLGFGKVFGGSNSNYSADGGDLDNILIYDYDVYSAE